MRRSAPARGKLRKVLPRMGSSRNLFPCIAFLCMPFRCIWYPCMRWLAVFPCICLSALPFFPLGCPPRLCQSRLPQVVLPIRSCSFRRLVPMRMLQRFARSAHGVSRRSVQIGASSPSALCIGKKFLSIKLISHQRRSLPIQIPSASPAKGASPAKESAFSAKKRTYMPPRAESIPQYYTFFLLFIQPSFFLFGSILQKIISLL